MSNEIPLSAPDITEREIRAVTDVLRSGRLSLGPQQERFERAVAERTGRRHGIAVSSGTAGLHVVLAALGIGPGDEVITTPFSFIASANCILYVGAKPVFVDIDPGTLNLDPNKVEAAVTDRTRAILAVETFGNPAGIEQLAAVAQRHEVPLIEDACEALGAAYKDRPVGSFGRAAVFAFYPNKQITTGEGGMIVTDDDRLADLARSLRNQGRPIAPEGAAPRPIERRPADEQLATPQTEHAPPETGGWLAHERLGYNYRLSEMQAALGVAQLQRLDDILQRRHEVALMYTEKLMDEPQIMLPTIGPETRMSWFVFVVRLAEGHTPKQRDRIITGMRRHEVGCANYFPPIHLQPFYRERFGYRQGDFPVTESVAARTIALPFFTRLDATQVELTTLTLKLMLQREQLLKPDQEQGRG